MKKEFEIPELIIVLFTAEDVIVTSSNGEPEDPTGDEYGL